MKKLFVLAICLSAWMFMLAELPANVSVPSNSLLNSYKTSVTDNVVVAFYTPAPVCNDIVFLGSYNAWSEVINSNTVYFQSVDGYDGWYVASLYDAHTVVNGKPVQLSNAGTLDWNYQLGDGAELISGELNIVPSSLNNEVDLENYGKNQPVVFWFPEWKNNNNPCITRPTHTYVVKLYAPQCEDYQPGIIGDFNGWQQSEAMELTADGYYLYSFRDSEGHRIRFRELYDQYWTNEITVLDCGIKVDGKYKCDWVVHPDITLGSENVIEVDYSEGAYEQCNGSSLQEYNVLTRAFTSSMEDFTDNPVELDELSHIWFYDSNNTCLRASAYLGGQYHTTESWCISQQVSLPASSQLLLNFQHAFKFTNNPQEDLTLYISESYNGENINPSEWTQLTIPTYSTGTTWTFVQSGNIDISAYAGKNVYIAYRYKSLGTESRCGSWEIRNLKIIATQGTCGPKLYWTYGNGVLEITGTGAMYDYTNVTQPWNAYLNEITSVVLSEGLVRMGESAFGGCTSLSSIISKATTPPVYADDCFANVDNSIPLYVPAGSVAAYRSANEWEQFTNILPIESPNPDPIVEYSLTVLSSNPTYGSVSGGGMYEAEALATLTATPANGYRFVQWQDGNTDNPRTVTVTENKAFTATFTKQTYSISTGSSNTSWGSVSGAGSYEYLTSATLTATPADGYRFVQWQDGNTDNPRSVIVSSDCSYIAEFSEDVPSNIIYYTSVDGEIIPPYTEETFGDAVLVSNVYNEGQGMMIFDRDVTSINSWAFGLTEKLTSLVIPKSVTNIKSYVLSEQPNLNSIVVEEGNPVYDSRNGSNAIIETSTNVLIAGCNTTVIPDGVVKISDGCFNGSRFTNIEIPSSVTYIGDAFGGCSYLQTLYIPAQVTHINSRAFSYCSALSSINVDEGNTIYDSRDNCNAVIATESNKLVVGCQNTIIPNSVTSIGFYAFSGCKATTISIPQSVYSIGAGAFTSCSNIISITIPDNVTILGDYTFDNCLNLQHINLPNGLQHIADGVFLSCTNLADITLPGSVESLGDYCFAYCEGLTSITCEALTPPSCGSNCFNNVDKTIPIYVPRETVDAYRAAEGWREFTNIQPILCVLAAGICGADGENLSWVIDCDSVLTISGTGAMSNFVDALQSPFHSVRGMVKSVVIEDGVTNIGDYAFSNMHKLTSVYMPNSLTEFGRNAFEWCSVLSEINIPNSVQNIGSFAFVFCSGLLSIDIPEGVTVINERTFYGCFALTSVSLPNSLRSIESCAFWHCHALSSITFHEGLESIGQSAFESCYVLESVAIPSTVNFIDYGAFARCPTLTSIVVDEDNPRFDSRNNCNAIIETESNMLYQGCLSTIIPNDVVAIDHFAFYGCQMLTQIDIPNSVRYIGQDAFNDCNLHYILIPSNVEHIYGNAFHENPNLMSVVWNARSVSGADYISEEDNSYYTLFDFTESKVTSFVFGDEVERIPAMLCVDMPITKLEFPENVAIIEEGAFQGCTSLTEITCRSVTPPTCVGPVFYEVDKSIPVYVPCGSIDTYQAAAEWGEFTNIIAIDCPARIEIPVTAGQWHYIAFPVDVDGADIEYAGNGTWGYYNSARRATGVSGWQNASFPLHANQGYIFYGDQTGTLYVNVDPATLPTGDKAITLTNYPSFHADNANWNFVGNPYYETYNVSHITPSGMYLYIWNGTGYYYKETGRDSYELQPLEAFFVQKKSTENSINFAAASADATAPARAWAADDNRYIDIAAVAGGYTDYTRVVLNETASVDYVVGYDLAKFFSDEAPIQLFTLDAQSVECGVQELPNGVEEIALGYTVLESGEVVISTTDMDETYYLYDAETGITTDLRQSDYTFIAESGTTVNRLSLRHAPATPTDLEHVDGVNKYVNTATKVIREGHVLILRGEKMYDLRGQEVR